MMTESKRQPIKRRIFQQSSPRISSFKFDNETVSHAKIYYFIYLFIGFNVISINLALFICRLWDLIISLDRIKKKKHSRKGLQNIGGTPLFVVFIYDIC